MSVDDRVARARIAIDIRSMCMGVPAKQYQSWSVTTVREYLAVCKAAQKLLAKANPSMGELSSMESQLRRYRAEPSPQVSQG